MSAASSRPRRARHTLLIASMVAVTAVVAAVALVVVSPDSSADADPVCTDSASWMNCLYPAGTQASSNAQIGTVAMPGAHDSGTWNIDSSSPYNAACAEATALESWLLGNTWQWAQTQTQSLLGQAQAGARFFDIRGVVGSDGNIRHCHTLEGDTWDSMLGRNGNTNGLLQFAQQQPNEVMILDFGHIYTSDPQHAMYQLNDMSGYIQEYVCPNAYTPTADEAANPGSISLQTVRAAGKQFLVAVDSDMSAQTQAGWNQPSCAFYDNPLVENYDQDIAANPAYASDLPTAAAALQTWQVNQFTNANNTSSSQAPTAPQPGQIYVTQWIWDYDDVGGASLGWISYLGTHSLQQANATLQGAAPQLYAALRTIPSPQSDQVNVILQDFLSNAASVPAWELNMPHLDPVAARYPLAQTDDGYDYSQTTGSTNENVAYWCGANIDLSGLQPPANHPDSYVIVSPQVPDHGQLYALNDEWIGQFDVTPAGDVGAGYSGPWSTTNPMQTDPDGNPAWAVTARYGMNLSSAVDKNTDGGTPAHTSPSDQVGWMGIGSNGLGTGCAGGVNIWDSATSTVIAYLYLDDPVIGASAGESTQENPGVQITSQNDDSPTNGHVFNYRVTGQPTGLPD